MGFRSNRSSARGENWQGDIQASSAEGSSASDDLSDAFIVQPDGVYAFKCRTGERCADDLAASECFTDEHGCRDGSVARIDDHERS